MEKATTLLFLLFFVVLAMAGIWLLLEPGSALGAAHHGAQFTAGYALMARQTGAGLLLAAGINLYCAVRKEARPSLHLLVLIYLSGLVASHGPAAFSQAAWLWLPVAIYALPLLMSLLGKLPTRLPSISLAADELAGEVKWFNPNKGFGFLMTADGEEYFVHFRAVQNGGRRSLRQGQKVRFKTRETDRGLQADQVYIEE